MVSKNLKIEIRPIPGRDGIKKFSENLEYFSQAHVISPFVNPRSLKYTTGLTKEDIVYLKENNFPYEFEDDNWKSKVVHPFWESRDIKVELKNTPIFLFPGKNLLDFVKWKYLLVNNYIYKSEEELKTGSKPEATHFIYNEEEEVAVKASHLEKQNLLVKKVSELTLKRKRDIILIIEDENTENKNENYLTVKLDKIINNKTSANQLHLLLDADIEDVSLSAEIKLAIQQNVLRKTKKGIFYFETNLGFSEEDVKEFLSKTENHELLLTIKSKIQ